MHRNYRPNRNTKDAIAKIKEYAEQDREELEEAIMIGFLNKETRHKWESLFGLGWLPSLKQFITVLSLKVAKR